MATRRRRSRFSAPRREAWRIGGRDLLWPGDPAIWSDISPILYPVVGWTRDGEERVDGVTLSARPARLRAVRDFRRRNIGPDFARLTLSDNASTRAIYPFAFALALEYRLTRRRARNRDRSRQSRRAARALCLRAAPRFPLAVRRGGTRGRARPVRKGGAARGSANSRRADLSAARPRADPALRPQSAAVRRPVRARRALLPRLREPVAHLRRRLGGVDHDGI